MAEGVEQIVLIIDFDGYSLSNAPPFSVSMEVLSILSNHYPERLGKAFLVNTPMIFQFFWKAISPFINKNTLAKIIFVKGGESEDYGAKTLKKYIDLEVLEKDFGGKSDFEYDHKTFWNRLIERDEKKQL